jgi:hypothetical protein
MPTMRKQPRDHHPSTTGISWFLLTRKNVKLAIILIAIVAGSIGGYIAYDRMWANNPVWNASIDKPFASNAVDNLSPICIKTGANNTDPNNPTFWTVLGIRNRSGYPMDTRWTLAFNDPAVNVFVGSTQTFHLAGSGDGYPKFQWSLNATQVAAQRSDPDPVHNLIISLDRTFNVTGYHGSYHFTRHDQATEAGIHPGFLGATIGGNVGKILGPPPCPDSVVNS